MTEQKQHSSGEDRMETGAFSQGTMGEQCGSCPIAHLGTAVNSPPASLDHVWTQLPSLKSLEVEPSGGTPYIVLSEGIKEAGWGQGKDVHRAEGEGLYLDSLGNRAYRMCVCVKGMIWF